MKQLQIRAYAKTDWLTLREVFRLNVPEYFGKNEEKDFEEYLHAHGETYFVAEDNGRILGGGGYHLTEDGGRLSWYLVRPEIKGKGAGRMLVDESMRELEKHRVRPVEVWTSQFGKRFFGKFGFKVVRTVKDYWTVGIDLVLMRID